MWSSGRVLHWSVIQSPPQDGPGSPRGPSRPGHLQRTQSGGSAVAGPAGPRTHGTSGLAGLPGSVLPAGAQSSPGLWGPCVLCVTHNPSPWPSQDLPGCARRKGSARACGGE